MLTRPRLAEGAPGGSRRATALVVDDDPSSRLYVEQVLEREGFSVVSAPDGLEAILCLERSVPDLVVSDLQMPNLDGLELVTRAALRWPGLPIILITVQEDVAMAVLAIQRGAVNYLLKPCPPETIVSAADRALHSRARSQPVIDSRIPELVGHHPSMVEVRGQVALAARNDVNVLITGATGTGKELVARAIHRISVPDAPFVAHNCAATPRDLFESQFFGHRRGAFTGADREMDGLFSQADGGVLFLDELETLTVENQAKLLRVMDDGEVRPVGSATTHRVRTRVISATNRDVREMIAAGELREDLYYRLRGVEISLPRLEDRREDIPLLIEHFLHDTGCRLTPRAIDALRRRAWPGNVRELRGEVRSMVMRASAGIADADALPVAGGSTAAARALPEPERRTLREMERELILAALSRNGGNRSRTARELGIDRCTLRRKLGEPEGSSDDSPDATD